MTAFNKGDAVDTSMGFSPLEGLLMATRPGDLDSGILMYLLREVGLSFPELNQMLNEKSGLKGISGKSSDIRELIGSMESRSKLAVEVYCYRIRKYLGAFLSVLEGADSIVFGGGVGENNPLIREKVLSCFHWLGLEIDSIKNEAAVGKDLCISAEQSNIDVWVLQVDEAREMILQTENLIK